MAPDDVVTPYPAGLVLTGRRVLVAGAGRVAQRRLPQLLAAGADVVVVAPESTAAVEAMATAGEIDWQQRTFASSDLDGVWYAVAATDVPEVNEQVSRAAEDRRVFCVRADDAGRATAWTPASGEVDGVTVAIHGGGDPRRAALVRDRLVEVLREARGWTDARRADPHDAEHGIGAEDAPMLGSVTLVSGGPGDPELLTLAGRRALISADVVVADRLAPRAALGDLPAEVELHDVSKLPRGRSAQQEEINRIIVEQAQAGRRVVRFKGGDSFVFGRGYEEVIACREAGVPVRVIPGVTSPVAVPGVAGIPVTHRGVAHEFAVVSGHLPPGHPDSLTDWSALARLRGTLVLMMAVENAPAIAAALLDGGRPADTPVAVVCDGTMPAERTVLSTLGGLDDDLRAAAVRPPAIIVVGEVVAVAHAGHYAKARSGLDGAGGRPVDG